ncbi:MAG: hypothetical protein JST38_04030 [Bacteroidetes bacterium]|nr:hypothetical protein [Bacteroidota bacterium]MBS1940028.1 hypothetical protein [Bacteroidota bacterium]
MHIEHCTPRALYAVPTEDILVFRTSVNSTAQVNALRPMLDLLVAGGGHWNFDLEDCDRILRVESEDMVRERITALLTGHGHICVELE